MNNRLVTCPWCNEQMRFDADSVHVWYKCDKCLAQSPKAIRTWAADKSNQQNWESNEARAYNRILEHMAVPRWISVEDEYPDSKLQVLAIVYEDMWCKGEVKPCPNVHVAYTRGIDEGWFDWHSQKWLDVTHWLPMTTLPELPEEE